MSAFGDLVLFVGVFGAVALVPTGMGLFFLFSKKRKTDQTSEPTHSSVTTPTGQESRPRQGGSTQNWSAVSISKNQTTPIVKKLIATLLISLPVAATAIDTPQAFTSPNIEMPPSSLIDEAQEKLLPFVSDMLRQITQPHTPIILISRMPIIVPVGHVDPTMVKGPDSSASYYLIVKAPAVLPGK